LLQQRGSGKGQEGGAESRSQGEEGKINQEGDGLGEGGKIGEGILFTLT
jgi:hypothetical protein